MNMKDKKIGGHKEEKGQYEGGETEEVSTA